VGSRRRTPCWLERVRARGRECFGRDHDRVGVVPMSDDRGALTDADEPGASLPVHDALLGLKCAGPSELQLEHLGAGDRVHSKRVHAREVRQDTGSSFVASCGVTGRF
jgi:hypothetical protein